MGGIRREAILVDEYDRKRIGGYYSQKRKIRIFGILLLIIGFIILFTGSIIVREAEDAKEELETEEDFLSTIYNENEQKFEELENKKNLGTAIRYAGGFVLFFGLVMIIGPRWFLFIPPTRRSYRNRYLRGRF